MLVDKRPDLEMSGSAAISATVRCLATLTGWAPTMSWCFAILSWAGDRDEILRRLERLENRVLGEILSEEDVARREVRELQVRVFCSLISGRRANIPAERTASWFQHRWELAKMAAGARP